MAASSTTAISNESCKYQLLPTVDELLPGEFYDAPETRPKTAWGPILIFAGVAYVTAVIVFVLLMVYTARTYVTETSIMSYDATGSNGYTCQMISKVSLSLTVDSTTDPTTAYTLVNIIESKSQCANDLATVNPCGTTQTYIEGTSTDIDYYDGESYVAVGYYGTHLVYQLDALGALSVYNYTSGIENYINPSAKFYPYTPTMGITSDGAAYYLSTSGIVEDNACTYPTCVVSTAAAVHENPIVRTYDTKYSGLINDNLYNLYLFNKTTLEAVSFDNSQQVVVLSLDPAQGMEFKSVAVYVDPDTTERIVFFNNDTTLLLYRDGVMSVLHVMYDDWIMRAPLVTDGQSVYYPYTTEYESVIGQYSLYDPEDILDVLPGSETAKNTVIYQSIAMRSDGARLFMTTSDTAEEMTVQMYTHYVDQYYDCSFDDDCLEKVSFQSGFAAAWYTCQDQLVTPVPQTSTLYASHCSSNGIVGQVVFQDPESYIFTPTDASAYALRTSPTYCSALYSQVCATVSDLPPYSCSRKKYPTFFTVLGTAYANTTFLLSVLIFLFGLILTRIAKLYPPPGTNVHRAHPNSADTIVPGESHSKDVEMGKVTQNPLSSQ